MKNLLTIAIAAIASLSPFVTRADDTVGRYQLVYAVTQNAISGVVTQDRTQDRRVWKIDTVTGQVWMFVSTTSGGKTKEAFVPVETSQP
jgi:hypothetical protein